MVNHLNLHCGFFLQKSNDKVSEELEKVNFSAILGPFAQ